MVISGVRLVVLRTSSKSRACALRGFELTPDMAFSSRCRGHKETYTWGWGVSSFYDLLRATLHFHPDFAPISCERRVMGGGSS